MGSSSYVPQMGVTFAPLLVAIIAIGGIVFACSVVAFRRAPMFGPVGRVTISACTAALAVLAMFSMIAAPVKLPVLSTTTQTPSAITSPEMEFTRIVYVTTAISITFVLILSMLMKGCRRLQRAWHRLFLFRSQGEGNTSTGRQSKNVKKSGGRLQKDKHHPFGASRRSSELD